MSLSDIFIHMVKQSFQCSAKIIVSVGPWGGDDGVSWDDGVYSSVRQVVITHAMGIYSIQFEYDNNGTSIWSEKHGGHGGSITDTVSPHLWFN